MKIRPYIKNVILAAVMAGMTLSYTACDKDDEEEVVPTPNEQEQNQDNNKEPEDEKQDDNEKQDEEKVTKYKISFVVVGNADKIKLSATSQEVAYGEVAKITYELEDGYAIYDVTSGTKDSESKTISSTCYGADKEVTITVKSAYNKVVVELSLSDGTTEVVSSGFYKTGDKIEYELESKYAGYYITYVSESDRSMMNCEYDENKVTITLTNLLDECTATIKTSECKAEFDIYKDDKFVSTLSVNKMELNKEYELDITNEMDGYDLKEIKTNNDNIEVKIEDGKIKTTITQNNSYSTKVYLEKVQLPVFTDTKQSVLGKVFVAWGGGISFEKTDDGIVMNYYEKVDGKVEKTAVYTFVKYDDWGNIFTYDDKKYYIYLEKDGDSYKWQKTVYNGTKTEFLALTEVASVDEMISTILSQK